MPIGNELRCWADTASALRDGVLGTQDGDSVDVDVCTAEAECGGWLTLPRLLQASSALTRQFVLTLASFAAVSESLSFSA